jgi:glycerol uptake facilitator-like aquaporin
MQGLMDEFIAEIIGTFIFLSVIIISVNNDKSLAWLEIGLTLSVCILFIGSMSGGHMNPAVSFMFYLNKNITSSQFMIYTLAQFIGAVIAYNYYKSKIKHN